MAQPTCVSLCIVLFIATFAGTRFGQGFGLPDGQIGWVQFLDNKDDVSFLNTADFINGTTISFEASLPKGTPWAYPVMDGTNSVTSGFRMANASGYYAQDILSWGRSPSSALPYYCAPNCIWVVDEHGFSVSDMSKGGWPQFIVSWLGPLESK